MSSCISDEGVGFSSYQVRCKCWSLFTYDSDVLSCWWMWVLGLSDVIVVYYMIRCECWACLFDEQVICKCWAKTYMMSRPTTNMKKGWLCRTSYDEIVHTWWWSRSSDDPDPVQWCWSRSSDDLDPVMPFYDDSDWEMIQIQMTWRWRWLEDEEYLMTEMTWKWTWSNDTEKNTSAENCVKRIPS